MSIQQVHGQLIPKGRVLAEPRLLDQLNRTLEELGIGVDHPGPPTVSFSCSQDTFEIIFDTALQPHPSELISGEIPGAIHFSTLRPIHIPPRLTDVVDDVILAEPPELDP